MPTLLGPENTDVDTRRDTQDVGRAGVSCFNSRFQIRRDTAPSTHSTANQDQNNAVANFQGTTQNAIDRFCNEKRDPVRT